MKSLGNWETRSAAMVALSVLMLSACSSSPKPAADTTSTLETDEYGRTVKTTTIREVQPNLNPPPPINTSTAPDSTNIQIDSDGIDGDRIQVRTDGESHAYSDDSRVHVRAPLVKVDSDDNTGSVHIKAPFVNINKNGHGDRTTIRIPGITIRGD